MDQLQTRLEALEQQMHTMTRRLRWWRGTASLLVGLGLVCLPLQVPHTQGGDELTAQALTLEQRVAVLEAKLKYLTTRIDSSGRPLMEVAGANLRVVNGAGKTDTANGLGNVIVGYNEIRVDEEFVENTRSGSHNVVVGRQHNYASFGGLVVGAFNDIRGAFAVVSGGQNNTASGPLAVVSGGIFNRASGPSAVVSGVFDNTASGDYASVSGGQNRTAAGDFDWVASSLVEDD
jgi:hypothetical protein